MPDTYGFSAKEKLSVSTRTILYMKHVPLSSPLPARNETLREMLTKGCRVLDVEYVMADRGWLTLANQLDR